MARLALGIFAALATLGLASFALAQDIQSPEKTAELRAEQAGPHSIVSYDAEQFDKYVGFYRLGPATIFTIHRDGGHFFTRLTGQVDVEVFPESQTQFFARVVPAQVSFGSDADGRVTELVLHQNGQERHAPRIEEAAARDIEAALAARIKENWPSPGTEAALRHFIESEERGQVDYAPLGPEMAAAVKSNETVTLEAISSLGTLKTITFQSVGPGGNDNYAVRFERGQTVWNISPLSPDGKIIAMGWRRLP